MQNLGLHRNIYKLYAYARTQECLDAYRQTFDGDGERGNRTFKEEFYYRNDILADSIRAIRYELKKAVHKYNSYRPHKNLAGSTPMAYIQYIISEVNLESQTM